MSLTHLPRLILGVLFGSFIALLYGWLIRPVEYIDTAPDSLREDFRTDYVLMVAETYHLERDLDQARVRWAALAREPPADMVALAIEYAVAQGFSRIDLDTLNRLLI